MNIEVRTVGDVKVLDWSGKITLGEGTMTLRNTVRNIAQGSAISAHITVWLPMPSFQAFGMVATGSSVWLIPYIHDCFYLVYAAALIGFNVRAWYGR